MTDHYAELEQEYLDLQERLGDQDLLSDQRAYAKAAKRYSELEEIVQCIRNLEKAQEDINTAKELLGEAVGEERDILREEMNEMQSVIEETEEGEYFKDRRTRKVRHNQHQLYMETQRHILSLARQAGFILKGKIDIAKV